MPTTKYNVRLAKECLRELKEVLRNTFTRDHQKSYVIIHKAWSSCSTIPEITHYPVIRAYKYIYHMPQMSLTHQETSNFSHRPHHRPPHRRPRLPRPPTESQAMWVIGQLNGKGWGASKCLVPKFIPSLIFNIVIWTGKWSLHCKISKGQHKNRLLQKIL